MKIDYKKYNLCTRCRIKVEKLRKYCPECGYRVRTGSYNYRWKKDVKRI